MMNIRILTTPLDRARSLDRVFDHALGSLAGRVWCRRWTSPSGATPTSCRLSCPASAPSRSDVHFEQNVLTISGTKASGFNASSSEEVRLFAAERANGEFTRSVRLPDGADTERIEATFANGLLTVTVPKAKAAQPRKIAVNVVSGATAVTQ